MRLLYMSCHETLEHDELIIFEKLGFQVFSIGHYTNPATPVHASITGPLPIQRDEEAWSIFNYYHDYEALCDRLMTIKAGFHNPYMFKVNENLAKLFDAVYVGYYEENLSINWDSFKDKFIILRTIGQKNMHRSEHVINNNVKRVFLSPRERYLHGYKPDAVIRQYVDTNFYQGWNGNTNTVLTVNKWLRKRGQVSCWDIYQYVTKDYDRLVIGFGNEDIEYAKSNISQEEIQKYRQQAGACFSTASKPGAVTYTFIEAMSTGMPVITIGPKLGNDVYPTFEAHEFIENGVNGFWSDDPTELKDYIGLVLKDKKLAHQIGNEARKTALKHFSFEKISNDWHNFFKENM